MRIVLQEYMPESYIAIVQSMGEMLSKDEKKMLEEYRDKHDAP